MSLSGSDALARTVTVGCAGAGADADGATWTIPASVPSFGSVVFAGRFALSVCGTPGAGVGSVWGAAGCAVNGLPAWGLGRGCGCCGSEDSMVSSGGGLEVPE